MCALDNSWGKGKKAQAVRRTLRHNVQDTNGTVSSLRPPSAKAVVIARSRFAKAIKWGAVSIGAPKAREHIHGRRLSKSVYTRIN